MRFDDRLATVLAQRAPSAGAARIQFHQLLDLLGTSPSEARGPTYDTAYLRMAELASQIPAAERAAMLAQPALRLRSPRLVAQLASAEPQVASAAIRAARLSEEQWLDLIPALPPAARSALFDQAQMSDAAVELMQRLGIRGRGLPAPESAPATAQTPATTTETPLAPPPAPPPSPEGIGAIVQRINAFRADRLARDQTATLPQSGTDAPRLPLREFTAAAPPPLQSADFATDSSGTISQAEQHTAPMLIGVNLAEYPHLAGQIRQHQPIRHTAIALTGGAAISGDWIIDAAPQFDRHAGHFTGYLGRLRRLAPPATTPQSAESPSTDSQSDRLRQILHELRTPVNAIQGFAEIIQQQLFGPAPHEYRALAANIASDAARMMAGFDELDRLARLDSGTQDSAIGSCDLGDCVAASVARLQHHGAKIHVTNTDADLTITMPPIEAERLIWRLLGTLNSRAEPDECLHITLNQHQNMAHIAHQIPAALAACDDETLFHTAPNIVQNTLASGLFGGGFALRLATAEAKAAGGQLRRDKGIFNLFLPMVNPANSADLTPSPAQNSNDKTGETVHIA